MGTMSDRHTRQVFIGIGNSEGARDPSGRAGRDLQEDPYSY